MQRTAVVESDAAKTRRTLQSVGFDDDQAQALVDLSGTAAERRELRADMAQAKTGVAELKTGVATFRAETRGEFARLDVRIDGLRDEMNARFEGLEGRIDARFEGPEGRLSLMPWFMGIGLTLYTGTTISLMVLLFRGVLT